MDYPVNTSTFLTCLKVSGNLAFSICPCQEPAEGNGLTAFLYLIGYPVYIPDHFHVFFFVNAIEYPDSQIRKKNPLFTVIIRPDGQLTVFYFIFNHRNHSLPAAGTLHTSGKGHRCLIMIKLLLFSVSCIHAEHLQFSLHRNFIIQYPEIQIHRLCIPIYQTPDIRKASRNFNFFLNRENILILHRKRCYFHRSATVFHLFVTR